MDIKSIQNQALSSMNSQNIEIQKAKSGNTPIEKQVQKEQENQYKQIKSEDLIKAANELNKKFEMINSQLKIEIDKDTGITVAKIIDKETKEVIRQIPPEVVLKIAKYLDELTGLLFNEKV